MENIKENDLVVDITDSDKKICKVAAIYTNGECIIEAIRPDKYGVIWINNSISIEQLLKINL